MKTGMFHPAPTLKDEDVKEIVETTAHRVIRMLERRGVLEPGEYDEFAQDQPVLAGMTSASIIGLVSIGERAGKRVRRVLQDPVEGVRTGHLYLIQSTPSRKVFRPPLFLNHFTGTRFLYGVRYEKCGKSMEKQMKIDTKALWNFRLTFKAGCKHLVVFLQEKTCPLISKKYFGKTVRKWPAKTKKSMKTY